MNLLSSLTLFHLCALKWKLSALLTKAITQILISFDEWHSFLWLLCWSIWPSSLSTQLSSFSIESTKGKIEKENFLSKWTQIQLELFYLVEKELLDDPEDEWRSRYFAGVVAVKLTLLGNTRYRIDILLIY